ncbi:restriction endonuclease subunit S [Mycolicibacterium mageritense]
MSSIDELVAEMAPAGVPYVRIGDIAQVGTGSADRKDASPDGKYPFYVRSKEILRSDSYEFDEDAILIPGEGGIGDIFHFVSGRYSLHQRAYRISLQTPSIDTKYAYYVFLVYFKKFILQKAVSATVTSIRKPMITDFRIPVPPLAVQREIVQVLDKFAELETGLEVELEAELQARHLQYAHYRDSILSFGGTVQRKPMGEIGDFIRGRRFTKDDVVDAGIPSIHYGEIYTHYGVAATSALSQVREELAGQLRYAEPGDVVIAAVGETVEDVAKAVAWLGDQPVAIHDDTFLFRHKMNPKFVSYLLQTADFHAQKNKYVARAKVKRVSGDGLAKILIPVPSMEEQGRIVEILDQFEALVDDLSTELPAELNARRKQYEYYRDRLLTFEELAV